MKAGALSGTVLGDVRIATRGLAKSPGFVAVVVISLALGIAANSTIFSILDAILYRPLPYPNSNRLVVLWQSEQAHPDSRQPPPIAENVVLLIPVHVLGDRRRLPRVWVRLFALP